MKKILSLLIILLFSFQQSVVFPLAKDSQLPYLLPVFDELEILLQVFRGYVSANIKNERDIEGINLAEVLDILLREKYYSKNIYLSLKDFIDYIAKNVPESGQKTEIILYILGRGFEAIDEYIARAVARLVFTLEDSDKAKVQRFIVSKAVKLEDLRARFIKDALPNLELPMELVDEILESVHLSRWYAEEHLEGLLGPPDPRSITRSSFIESIRRLGGDFLHSLKSVLDNLIVYAVIKEPLKGLSTSDAQRTQTFIRGHIYKMFKARNSYLLYPQIRQFVKLTATLPMALVDRMNELAGICESEVNVSTHKGQDLFSLSHLRRILYDGHQRDPRKSKEVTDALTELLGIIERLSDPNRDLTEDFQGYDLDSETVARIDRIGMLYSRGQGIDALLLLTNLRQETRDKIMQKWQDMQEKYRIESGDWVRFVCVKEGESNELLRLIELDILLENRLREIMKDVADKVVEDFKTQMGETDVVRNMASLVHIIVENAVISGFGDESFSFFASEIYNTAQKSKLEEIDFVRMYGYIRQVIFFLEAVYQDMQDTYLWRAERILEKGGQIGIVQDVLGKTTLSQMGERIIVAFKDGIEPFANIAQRRAPVAFNQILFEKVGRIAGRPLQIDEERVLGEKDYADYGRHQYGNKLWGLHIMQRLGLKVPPFFGIIRKKGRKGLLPKTRDDILQNIKEIESGTGRHFGKRDNPLLLSLRPSFPVAIPGEFPTVTNAGINEEVFQGLKDRYGAQFAYENYLRFIRSYAELIGGVERGEFPEIPLEGDEESLSGLLARYKAICDERKVIIPDDPFEQVTVIAEKMMYGYRGSDSQALYMAMHGIHEDWPITCIVQEMVYGNLDNSYTAVVHSGDRGFQLSFVEKAQGEDILLGSRRRDVLITDDGEYPSGFSFTKDIDILRRAVRILEEIYGPVEIEITNQGGILYFIQTRRANLSPETALNAVENLLQRQAIDRASARRYLHPLLGRIVYSKVKSGQRPLASGIPISGDSVSGVLAFSIEKAREYTEQDKSVILALEYTPLREIKDIYSADIGVITRYGGRASHYADWCRSLHRPYIVLEQLEIAPDGNTIRIGGRIYREGEVITIDAGTGNIYDGVVAIEQAKVSTTHARILFDLFGERVSIEPGEIEGVNYDSSGDQIPGISLAGMIISHLGASYIENVHHGAQHAVDLLGWANSIAGALGVSDKIDWKVLIASICLHDITSHEEQHGESGALAAERILSDIGILSPQQIEKVKRCIVLHEIRTPEGQRQREEAGIEAQILYDADQLDAFGYKGIYRYLAVYYERGKTLEYIKNTILDNVNTRFAGLTFDESREIGRADYEITRKYFERLQKGDPDAEKFAELVRQNHVTMQIIGASGRDFPVPDDTTVEDQAEAIQQSFLRSGLVAKYVNRAVSIAGSFFGLFNNLAKTPKPSPAVYAFRFEDVIADVRTEELTDDSLWERVITERANTAIAKTAWYLRQYNPQAILVVYSDKDGLSKTRMEAALNAIEAAGVFGDIIIGDEYAVAREMAGKGNIVFATSREAVEGHRTVKVSRATDGGTHRSMVPFEEVVTVMTEMLDGLEEAGKVGILEGYRIWLQQAGFNEDELGPYLAELRSALDECSGLVVSLPIPPLPRAGSVIEELDREYLQKEISTYA